MKISFKLSLIIYLILFNMLLMAQIPWQSKAVYYDSNGRLQYKSDTEDNRIPDFSYAGYKNGEEEIPSVEVVKIISPIEGDNTQYIQNAINDIGKMPLDQNGIRGALLLTEGIYRVNGTLKINYSGIVLRGIGDGSDSLSSTIIYGKGNVPHQRTIIVAGGGVNTRWPRTSSDPMTNITSQKVLTGSRSFNVENPSGFNLGDNIIIYHPCTEAWLNAVDYGATEADPPWTINSLPIIYNRYITNIDGNTITIDAPVFNILDRSLSQSYIYKYSRAGILTNIGIENLRVEIEAVGVTTDPQGNENHAWNAIELKLIEDAWVKDCTMLRFGLAGVMTSTASRITIANCRAIEPISQITGERRYNFNMYQASQLILIKDCYTSYGRHDYVSNGVTYTSGCVFTNCRSDYTYYASEGHRQWSQGLLFDNIFFNSPNAAYVIGLYNRGSYGTGHGWAVVNSVAWNCSTLFKGMVIQKPPTGQNYAVGCFGNITGSGPFNHPAGYIEGSNQAGLNPSSLYQAQLNDRLKTAIISINSGNWSETSTWQRGLVPGETDDVIIGVNDTVTINIDAVMNNLTVQGTLQFNDTSEVNVIVNGNIYIDSGAVFKVLPRKEVSRLVHTLELLGNLTHNGSVLDFRDGSNGSTLGAANLKLSGADNSIIAVNDTFSSTNGNFNAVTINKTDGAKIILESDLYIDRGSSLEPFAQPILAFHNGIIETGDFSLIALTTTADNITGYSSFSYVNGSFGRGMANTAGVNRQFFVGDETNYRPVWVRSSTTGGTGHYVIVRAFNGNANTGTSMFTGGIDKVSGVRYFKVTYKKGTAGEESMSFDRFSLSYGTDDGVNEGNVNLRIAYSIDDRVTWKGINQTVAHTTDLTDPPTVITSDPLPAPIVLDDGQSFFLALARLSGTTENNLDSLLVGVKAGEVVPTSFNLSQNFPNPFNPSTNIEFAVPESGIYSLKIYNSLGEEATTLMHNELNPGFYKFTFESNGLASGIYFYRLAGEKVSISRKMILMK